MKRIRIRVSYSSVAGVFARLLCLHTTLSNGVMLSLEDQQRRKITEGNLSEEEAISSLPPGCKFERYYEREWRIVPERGGAVQFERVCGKVYDCDDSNNNNTSCGDWQAL